jgi:uncharacterized membrane protein
MKRHSSSIEIARAAPDVFAYLADFRNDPEWRHDIAGARVVSGTPGSAGCRYSHRAADKKGTTYMIDATGVQPGSGEIAFSTVDASPVAVRGTYRVAAADSSSKVTFDIELHPSGFVKLFEPFMGPTLRKTTARYLSGLKTALER